MIQLHKTEPAARSNGGRDVRSRTLRLAAGLFALLPASAIGQLTEPWQRDWDAFAQAAIPLLTNSAIPAPGQGAFLTLPVFAGREFEWAGQFAGEIGNTTAGVTALMAMKVFSVPLANNRVGTMFTVVTIARAGNPFAGLRRDQPVRFRGRFARADNMAVLRLGNGVISFSPWTNEVELISVPATQGPRAVMELSAQGRTAANGGSLSLTATQGQRVTVTLDGTKSTAGTGSIARHEWIANGSPIGSGARIESSFASGASEVSLRVTNSGGQTDTATARIVVTAANPPGPPPPTLLTSNPIVHGATFQPLIAPRTWVTIRGTNLSATTRTWRDADIVGGALPESLDGVSVRMGGSPAFIHYVSPGQINVLSPDSLAPGTVTVDVTAPSGRVSGTVQAAPAAPGLFTLDPKRMYPAATHGDGTLAAPAGLFGGMPATRPVEPGASFQAFGSGFGDTNPQLRAGRVVDSPAPLAQRPAVFLSGSEVEVAYAGVVSPGLTQLNLVAPQVPPGDHFLEIQAAGRSTQDGIFLCVGGANSQLRVSQSALTFRGSGQPLEPQTVEVMSTGGALAYVASASTSEGGNWLRVEREGFAPRAALISVDATGLRPGVYRGAVTFQSCVDESGPKTVEVRLEVPEPPPAITALSQNSIQRDSTAIIRVTGANLASVTSLAIEPSTGIAISNVRPTATSVAADFAIAPDALLGPRSVFVVSPSGRSNALTLRIDEKSAGPQISNLGIGGLALISSGSSSLFVMEIAFDFTDDDGDIVFPGTSFTPQLAPAAANIRLEVQDGARRCVIYEGSGPPLNKPGQTSGRIDGIFPLPGAGAFGTGTFMVTLTDRSGKKSNTLEARSPFGCR